MEGGVVTIPQGFTVYVVCTDQSHEGRTVKVTNFTYEDWRYASGEDASKPRIWTWDLGKVDSRSEERAAVGEAMDGDAPLSELLGAEVVPGVRLPVHVEPDRMRYSMACRLCGLNVEARHERLVPVLDRLAENGIASVELNHMRAIIS